MKKLDPTTTKQCSICGQEYTSWGHNAWPINDGRCCDSCNDLVIIRRLMDMRRPPAKEPTV